ncbi:JAB1/Mov34/MPN/PAD-1 ubiquitin protease domain-containing protein [Ditylenchus destructor]|nr:JAB1/Mov34/MPN/PAD-1 ubiquitin protease domain-containing protein [Ditylenchus destructor]
MAESSEQVALVHSLVTLSVSDQWTRARVQNDAPTQVVGALLGKQSGRNIEILNTFEVKSDILENGCIIIDEEYYANREALYKETFPELEFLGFYITGNHTETNEQDVAICKQAMKFSECPYLMKFNANTPVVFDKLSIGVFESVADPANESAVIFHTIPVKLVSELSEQIGLDHVARFSTVGNKTESTVSKYLSGQFGAMNNLIQGIVAANTYVKAVRAGKVERDDALLRDINKLCQKLREVKPNDLAEKETKQAADNKLIVLLTAITSVEGSLFDLVTKLNVLSSERHAVQYPSSMQFQDFPAGRHYRRHYSGGGGGHAPHHRGFGFNF